MNEKSFRFVYAPNVTEMCSNRCHVCYVRNQYLAIGRKRKKILSSLEEIESEFSSLIEKLVSENDRVEFVFSPVGGELLLYPKLNELIQLYEKLKSRYERKNVKILFSLVSSFNFDRNFFQKRIRPLIDLINILVISIHSNQKTLYSKILGHFENEKLFFQAIENFNYLREKASELELVQTNTLILNSNIDQSFLKFLSEEMRPNSFVFLNPRKLLYSNLFLRLEDFEKVEDLLIDFSTSVYPKSVVLDLANFCLFKNIENSFIQIRLNRYENELKPELKFKSLRADLFVLKKNLEKDKIDFDKESLREIFQIIEERCRNCSRFLLCNLLDLFYYSVSNHKLLKNRLGISRI